MQRVTITVDDELMLELDRIIAARGYQGRIGGCGWLRRRAHAKNGRRT